MNKIIIMSLVLFVASCHEETVTATYVEQTEPTPAPIVSIVAVASKSNPAVGETVQLTTTIHTSNISHIGSLQWVLQTGPSTDLVFETPNDQNTKVTIWEPGTYTISIKMTYCDLNGNISQVSSIVNLSVQSNNV